MSRPFDIDLLMNFLAVVDSGGFTAAARETNSTQATVSAKIARLEQQSGQRLLERNRRGLLRRTREGEVIEQMARDILRLQQMARRRLEELPVSGTVRIGMSDDFATGRRLTSLLGKFSARFPLACLDVRIVNGETSLKLLDDGKIDFALFKTEGMFPTGSTELWRERLVWVGGTGFASLMEEEEIRLITFDPPCCYRSRAIDALKRAGRRWRIVYVSPSLAGVHAALAANLGLTLLPASLVTSEIRSVAGSELPPAGMVGFGFLNRPNLSCPAAITFGDFLQKMHPHPLSGNRVFDSDPSHHAPSPLE
ncbi:MAG: LysR family transcriptional regulator [Telmatospirillum sp.]|nr:LysR family transcriptional regulator [Telmatospirillum sp.]